MPFDTGALCSQASPAMPFPRGTVKVTVITGGGIFTAATNIKASPSRRCTVPATPPCSRTKASSQA